LFEKYRQLGAIGREKALRPTDPLNEEFSPVVAAKRVWRGGK